MNIRSFIFAFCLASPIKYVFYIVKENRTYD